MDCRSLGRMVSASACLFLAGCLTQDGTRSPSFFNVRAPQWLSRADVAEKAREKNSGELAENSHEASTKLVSAAQSVHQPSLVTLSRGDDFDQLVLNSDGPVLIDFYADWCGPCQKQAKILHDLEETASQNEASIIKVNVDEFPELQQRFKVSSLPTLIVVKNGKIETRQTGLTDRRQVAAWLTN